jgi:preprotein translocase subunit SecG
MITVLLIIHLMVASGLVGLVLLQRSEGGALGIGGGGGGFMTGRGASNFLTRATAGLAAAFFTTSLLLTILATRPNTSGSILDTPASAPAKSGTKTEPSAPAAPASGRGGILDKLQPVQPGGPRAPQSK